MSAVSGSGMGVARPPARRGALLAVAALLLLAACVVDAPPRSAGVGGWENWPAAFRYEPDAHPVVADSGMVVTTDSLASAVGVGVLRRGGTAVDAAVAVAFALAVVNPEAGNLGGGGFMVARLADGEAVALDFREKAPLAATHDMFLDAEGELTARSVVGHLASGVPGTVMGLWSAHERYGTLPWPDLVAPAIALAEGFTVRERFLYSLTDEVVEGLEGFETSRATFLPGGEPPALGSTFEQPELAATLRRIQRSGADGFYRGETADLIVAEMERGGGIITHQDLAAYDAVWRGPVRFSYRGHTVLSMPPVSSGGVTMALAGNILETFPLPDMAWHSAREVHLFVEAWRRAFVDRNHYLADPAFVELPLEALTSPAYARFRASAIDPSSATPSAAVSPGLEAFRGEAAPSASAAPVGGRHTTHVSIVDAAGNAVSLTTTLNSWYGSKVTVRGAGFVLNNEMDDFAAKPGTPNQYGLVEGEANAVAPGKRMLSSMTPSIVLNEEGDLFMVTGTPGGSSIITTVFQTISNVVDYGMNVAQAVVAPRIHHQWLPDQITYEEDGLPADVVARLEAMGHTVIERGGVSGDVQAIRVRPGGALAGFSDPRRGGTALGYGSP